VLQKKNITSDSIVFLGDSLTEWFSIDEYFEKANLVNRGVSGDITDGVLYRLEEIINANPKTIYLMIGINDVFQGYPVDQIVRNLKTIIDRIREESSGTQIFVQSILPINEDYFIVSDNMNQAIIEINKQLESFCKLRKVEYLDLHPSFLQDGKLNPAYTYDGGHLTEKGYEHWATLLLQYLD